MAATTVFLDADRAFPRRKRPIAVLPPGILLNHAEEVWLAPAFESAVPSAGRSARSLAF